MHIKGLTTIQLSCTNQSGESVVVLLFVRSRNKTLRIGDTTLPYPIWYHLVASSSKGCGQTVCGGPFVSAILAVLFIGALLIFTRRMNDKYYEYYSEHNGPAYNRVNRKYTNRLEKWWLDVQKYCRTRRWLMGSPLAMVLAENGHQVTLWTHNPEQAREIKPWEMTIIYSI